MASLSLSRPAEISQLSEDDKAQGQEQTIDSIADKVRREIQLFTSLKETVPGGFGQRVKQAFENPGQTSAEVLGAVAFGAAFTLVSRRPWMFGKVLEPALSYTVNHANKLFILAAGADMARRVAPPALKVWMNGSTLSESKRDLGDAVGAAGFEYGVLGFGGVLGAKLVPKPAASFVLWDPLSLKSRLVAADMPPEAVNVNGTAQTMDLSKLYKLSQESVFQLTGKAQNGKQIGSAFAVGDGLLVTDYHVVRGVTDTLQVFSHSGRAFKPELIKYDATNDIAILRIADTKGQFSPKPLRLSEVPLGDGHLVIASGYPYKGWSHIIGKSPKIELGLSPGIHIKTRPLNESVNSWISSTAKADIDADRTILVSLLNTSGGGSGGPLLDMDGNVVGIVQAGGTTLAGRTTVKAAISAPTSDILPVLESARQALKAREALTRPGFTMKELSELLHAARTIEFNGNPVLRGH